MEIVQVQIVDLDQVIVAVALDPRFAGDDLAGWLEVHAELVEDFGEDAADFIAVEAAGLLLIHALATA